MLSHEITSTSSIVASNFLSVKSISVSLTSFHILDESSVVPLSFPPTVPFSSESIFVSLFSLPVCANGPLADPKMQFVISLIKLAEKLEQKLTLDAQFNAFTHFLTVHKSWQNFKNDASFNDTFMSIFWKLLSKQQEQTSKANERSKREKVTVWEKGSLSTFRPFRRR